MSGARERRVALCAVAVGAILGVGFVGGGCGSDEKPAPTPSFTAEDVASSIDWWALTRDAERRAMARTQVQRGFACGWHAGWMATIREARHEGPRAFRSDAMASAFGWGFITLLLGFGGTFVLAWALPRLRRRPKKPEPELPDGVKPAWGVYFRDLGARALTRLGRALRVEQFDPLLASERQRAIESCRDTSRQLQIAIDCVEKIADERPDQASAYSQKLEEWRSEVTALRRRLEGPGSLPRELAPDRVGPRIEVMLRAARDLRLRVERLAIQRALGGGATETPHVIDTRWAGLDKELAQRPETPRDRHALLNAELAGWVRTVGVAGAGAMTLSLMMMAAWMAAGAFPLFFALLFAMGGLGAVIVARVHLHRAGRLPLLPGFADRVVSWLTGVCGVVFAVVVGSSWMSTESGLDLGDPPPVMMPDPKLSEAPLLWKGVELHPRPVRGPGGGANGPTERPGTAEPPGTTEPPGTVAPWPIPGPPSGP